MGVCQGGDLTAEGGERRFGCRGWVPACTGTTSGSRGWVPVCTGTTSGSRGWVPACTGMTVGFPGFPRRAGEGGFQTRPYGSRSRGGVTLTPVSSTGQASPSPVEGEGGRGDPAPGPRSSGTAGGHVGPPLRSAVGGGGAPSPPYRVRGRLPAVLRWRLTLA